MKALRRIVFVACLAGLIGGGLVTIAHHFGTASIIAKAEVFERAADLADQKAAEMARSMPGMAHPAEAVEWEPADGIERTMFTALADIVTSIAFALLLVSAMALRGRQVDWRSGLYWGLAGFATFTLAPTLGLPPELPGTAAADLFDRQVWWAVAAVMTGAGLAMILLQTRPALALVGVVLLFVPHLYGAPQPDEFKSVAPETLAHHFVVASILTSLLLWSTLGALSGVFYRLMDEPAGRRLGGLLAAVGMRSSPAN